MEKKFGLIGLSVSHSFSKSYFDEKFFRDGLRDYHYELYPLEKIDDLKQLLSENPELCGLNVTVPYKEKVLSHLTEIDNSAKQVGAVNVIKVKGGKLFGYNTDSEAFYETIKHWYPKTDASRAIILGTGGSSKAVQAALKKLNIPFLLVSRNESNKADTITYDKLKATPAYFEQADLLINTTPLGMSPKDDGHPPIDFDCLTERHYVYDLIYNPARTVLLQRAEMKGCTIKNGLEMLHIQAEKSWAIWNN